MRMVALGAPTPKDGTANPTPEPLTPRVRTTPALEGSLRLWFYVKGFPPRETGGPAEVARHLAREWLRDPHVRLTLVVQTDSEEDEIRDALDAGERLTVLRLPYYPSSHEASSLRPVLSALRNADVAHFNEFPFRHFALVLAAKVYGIPIVFSLHGLLSQEAGAFLGPAYPLVVEGRTDSIRLRFPRSAIRLLLAVYRWLSAGWSAVVIPSEALKRDATALESIDPSRVVVIPHGVEIRATTPLPTGPHGSLPRILFVGKLEEIKGPDLLFAALDELRLQGIAIEASIVGNGSLEDKLRTWADRMNPHRISFEGTRRGKELEALYAAADIVVVPSRRETLSLVALEAMAAGRPILATNVGGIPEIVDGRRNGLLVRPDPASLAAGLRHLIENPEVRDAMSTANLADARRRPWSAVAARYLRLYASLSAHI